MSLTSKNLVFRWILAFVVSVLLGPQTAHSAEDADNKRAIDVDTLKSGKLVRYGVTLGGALALHTSLGLENHLSSVAPSFMPYVAFFPAVWAVKGRFSRAYCAARFVRDDAQSIANAAARAEALVLRKEKLEHDADYQEIQRNIIELKIKIQEQEVKLTKINNSILDAINTKNSNAAKMQALKDSRNHINYLLTLYKENLATEEEKKAKKAEVSDDEIERLTKWNIALRGRCGKLYTYLGIYYGLPLEFTANSFMNDTVGYTEKARTFNSYGSIGLMSSPRSPVSFFVGISFLKTHEEEGPDQTVYAFTFGIGGNLDVFGTLFNI